MLQKNPAKSRWRSCESTPSGAQAHISRTSPYVQYASALKMLRSTPADALSRVFPRIFLQHLGKYNALIRNLNNNILTEVIYYFRL